MSVRSAEHGLRAGQAGAGQIGQRVEDLRWDALTLSVHRRAHFELPGRTVEKPRTRAHPLTP